jgi:predicted TIM-barrel fold metal-dependent hydrolase
MNDKTVYILGAGCSANYGYPLAKDFRAVLSEYGDGLSQKPGYTENLVQAAKQIWVIGYSFDPNDRKAMIELLRKSDCEIIIQNRTKEGAEAICEELKPRYDDFAPRLKPFGKPF